MFDGIGLLTIVLFHPGGAGFLACLGVVIGFVLIATIGLKVLFFGLLL